MTEQVYSEPIPLTRTLEHQGKRYVYGYGALFTSPDGHETVITKQFIEENLERLQRFPAVRFMHKKPLGQIVWNESIIDPETGHQIKTQLTDTGLFILARVYDERNSEWNMLKQGRWGFSWSAIPTRTGRICFGDKCYTSFESGKLFEFSVVDSPSHMDCVAYIMERTQRIADFPAPPSPLTKTTLKRAVETGLDKIRFSERIADFEKRLKKLENQEETPQPRPRIFRNSLSEEPLRCD